MTSRHLSPFLLRCLWTSHRRVGYRDMRSFEEACAAKGITASFEYGALMLAIRGAGAAYGRFSLFLPCSNRQVLHSGAMRTLRPSQMPPLPILMRRSTLLSFDLPRKKRHSSASEKKSVQLRQRAKRRTKKQKLLVLPGIGATRQQPILPRSIVRRLPSRWKLTLQLRSYRMRHGYAERGTECLRGCPCGARLSAESLVATARSAAKEADDVRKAHAETVASFESMALGK